MNYSCEMIRDLLPLYIDDVASPPSRQAVEAHLAECADCRRMLGRLQNDEAENVIAAEKENVLDGQRRFFTRKSAITGSIIAGIFMVPVLVCLIVNLAAGEGLDWFFIVLASLLVAASLLVVPLMAPAHKGLWTLGSFTVSLLLLFGVCCLYTGGKWFFLAGTAVLFGLSLLFLPFVVRTEPLAGYLGDRKGLAVMAVDTVLFVVMMVTIGLHTGAPGFFPVAASISLPLVALAWALFFLIRHVSKRRAEADGPEAEVSDNTAQRLRQARPDTGPARQAAEPRRLQAWEIVLLAVGAPLWIPLLIAAFAVLLSLYVVVWALVISLWAVEVSFIAGAAGSVILGIWSFFRGNGLQGIVMLCAGAVLAGLSIPLFYGCMAATGGAVGLPAKITDWVQSLFYRKENAS